MMNSNKMSTMDFRDLPDITEEEEERILSTKIETKIVDKYQFPCAVRMIIDNMESIREKFPIEKFLSMEKMTECPQRIENCTQHCIREIFPDTLIDSHCNDRLYHFFHHKNRWCSKKPANVVDAIITLSLRTNEETTTDANDIESYDWYCKLIGNKIVPIIALCQYEKASVNMAILLGLLPNDETFYEIRARDMAYIAADHERDGILKLRKDVLEKDKSENEDKYRMFSQDKKKNKGKRVLRKEDYALTKYCYCCICHKLGHIARYCRNRHAYVGDT